jgi:hypothetical protein
MYASGQLAAIETWEVSATTWPLARDEIRENVLRSPGVERQIEDRFRVTQLTPRLPMCVNELPNTFVAGTRKA